MKINKAKFDSWFKKYQPSCQVCGGRYWDSIEDGLSFLDPNDINRQMQVIALTCKECGNMMLVNKDFFE